jgi:hypothetical protein
MCGRTAQTLAGGGATPHRLFAGIRVLRCDGDGHTLASDLQLNFFHSRDYDERCIFGTCHENDNEGLILTVRKYGSEFGRLQVLATLAHGNVCSYGADPGIQDGLHRIVGSV